MLTPLDIHNKEFKRSFRGYNEDEIDEFLDRVVNDYEKLWRENERLKEDLERSTRDVTQFKQLEKNLQDTLLVAQKTAEEVTSTAKKRAEETKAEAETQAQELISRTTRECKAMREEARLSAQRSIDEAAAKVRVIVAEYDRLAREKNQFLMKLRTMMESELTILNHTIDNIPHPEEEERAAREKQAKETPPVTIAKEEPQEEPPEKEEAKAPAAEAGNESAQA
ncbi:MAG: DivIVA domain-containing protein [Selenomonadaceae bacterium]|nr:DivIVA domain-containing protein [Selenomonadaceae bacterium]